MPVVSPDPRIRCPNIHGPRRSKFEEIEKLTFSLVALIII